MPKRKREQFLMSTISRSQILKFGNFELISDLCKICVGVQVWSTSRAEGCLKLSLILSYGLPSNSPFPSILEPLAEQKTLYKHLSSCDFSRSFKMNSIEEISNIFQFWKQVCKVIPAFSKSWKSRIRLLSYESPVSRRYWSEIGRCNKYS